MELCRGTGCPVSGGLREYWTPERKRMAWMVLCATAVCSFAAHGFLFSNEFFSHDSISYFTYATGSFSFYTSIGRFAIPVYELLKGDAAAPWLIGLLFIVWMSLTAWLMVHLFAVRTTGGILLTCGLLCTNLALTLTGATYVYCMDEYAFALFLAVAAVWCFHRGRWWVLPGLGALVVSLAVYQAYFTVAASLCLLLVMVRLRDNGVLSRTVLSGVCYLALLAAGFAAYYGVWTLVCSATGVAKRRVEESLLAGSGLGKLLGPVRDANLDYVKGLFDTSGVLGWWMPVVHVLLLVLLGWYLLRVLMDKQLHWGNKVLLLALVCLLPTAFNSAAILLAGSATQLMTFAGELLYLLPLLCREREERTGAPLRTVTVVLLCCVLWQHVVYANQVYLKKELDKTATVSFSARIIDRIELLEGYVPAETPVAFVGRLDRNDYLNRGRDEFQALDKTVGLWSDYSATYNLGRYLTDYLNYPLVWDTETDFSQVPEVQVMPAFPDAGGIRMVDGTVVVKLS